ncbi:MAG: 50S ribosomal protein L28 [Rhodospirillaceae bacterium]|nr:50S ribosomal protein L28 [Rhodospirillaceae bacterium]|tara:strand:- start:2084 stop:2386 length:303 start_codon:yes stop_codon:yes gene_type:complete
MSRTCELTGKTVMVGNNRSHAENKSKRVFRPNLIQASLFSEALGHTVRVRVSTNALRTVEKRGGIDAFLTSGRDAKLPASALRLKRRVEKALERKAAAAA